MTGGGAPETQRMLVAACLDVEVPFFWQTRGVLLIAQPGVRQVLSAVVGRDVHVLGFEGFDLDGRHTLPRLDLIVTIDPDGSFRHEPWRAIEMWPEDVWVDVTLAIAA